MVNLNEKLKNLSVCENAKKEIGEGGKCEQRIEIFMKIQKIRGGGGGRVGGSWWM